MTDEDRQRQMDFILSTLARVAAKQERSEDERRADEIRIGRLEDAHTALAKTIHALASTALAQSERMDSTDNLLITLTETTQTLAASALAQGERMDSADGRLNQFMDSWLARSNKSDEKLDRLVETVDRYITARGNNGSNGSGG
jgi:uncharacterized coiled-coil protein SlyX